MRSIEFIDSHTAGEPTRVVLANGPDLGHGPIQQRLERFRDNHDSFRSRVVNEPRGSDVIVGALLVAPSDPKCTGGIIFFNNVGYLGMCGHGTIGVVVTLAHIGRIQPGVHRFETGPGIVTVELHTDGRVSVTNVDSFRQVASLGIEVPGFGPVRGDVAWGGNWFFLVEETSVPIGLPQVEYLTEFAWRVRQAVNAQGYPTVDHVELTGLPSTPGADAKNFVLCPGKAYDRSPCGTGTSAKLACLAASGALAAGESWVQEGILGTTFAARYRWKDRSRGHIEPTITGSAYITAKGTLWFDERDPFPDGIRSALS